jgi:hypothetical protein
MNLPNECFFTKRAVLIKLYIYVLLHTNSSNVQYDMADKRDNFQSQRDCPVRF